MGIESLLQQNMQNAGLAGTDRLARNAMFPQGQMDKTQYAVPSQMPTSAETIRADYDAPSNAYTGMPTQPFAAGGIAALRYAEGGEASPWDPASGQVILQKFDQSNIDPETGAYSKSNVDYTIPKDNIKTFIPDMDTDTGMSIGSGQYVLKDGSTMRVDNQGIVQSATPGRDEYTLNKEGYYQPTGSGLNWRGDQNTLTKTIGGVEVNVPGIYHKGGYQDQQGNLRVDANGVPVALAPNYLDSGFGKSGLSDAAPYVTAALMAAMTGGAGATGFAGMVPAEETLAGYLGSLGAEGAAAMGPTYAELGYTPAAAEGVGAAASQSMSLKDAYNAYKYANMAKNVLGAIGGAGGSSAGSQGIGGQGINPYASTGFNPGPVRSGLGIDATPAAQQAQPTFLSKLSEFKGDYDNMAAGGIAQGGGHLGGYSDGGRLLKGPGDGMSDNIPASIGDKQPARLADGEFVVPADVVSHLGNGSTDAGAKQLYAMMDRIRKARTGNPKQGKQINPNKFLPKG